MKTKKCFCKCHDYPEYYDVFCFNCSCSGFRGFEYEPKVYKK